MRREPHGYTIFCDDIRREEGNKVTLVGIYSGDILVHGAFPATFPKFGLAVSFRMWADDPNRDNVPLLVFLPGDPEDAPSIKGEIPLSQFPPPDVAKSEKLHRLDMHFLFSPLTLKEPGSIKVRAISDGKEIKLGSIKVQQQDSQT